MGKEIATQVQETQGVPNRINPRLNIPVQFRSVTLSCPALCDPMGSIRPSLPVHHKLLEIAQTYVHWVHDAIQTCHPLASPSPSPSVFPSLRVFFQWVSSLWKWPKYWNLSCSISSSNEHSGLISIRMDWLDLLAVQRTLKNLLQHHSLKASILWCSAYFILQLSHPHITTG